MSPDLTMIFNRSSPAEGAPAFSVNTDGSVNAGRSGITRIFFVL
jgi:hypothetical protein